MILGLFFTRNVSLKLWVDSGLFEREKLIYEKYLNGDNFKKVYWFTYGSSDKVLAEELKRVGRLHSNIEVFSMPKFCDIPKLGNIMYTFILPFFYADRLKECNILKTNQMDGSWSAVFAKWMYKKLLVVRTGYTLTQLWKNTNRSKIKIRIYEWIEFLVYKNANAAIVTSYHNKAYIEQQYRIKNIFVISNFIDIERFKNMGLCRDEKRLLFVGRLNVEKNIKSLISAVAIIGMKLDIYGKDEMSGALQEYVANLDVDISFKGTVSNSELPMIYNSYKYYVLPSLFEGMPKTLLEAMGCGCICIGTNVTGINEVIIDSFNGFLTQNIDSDSIIKCIQRSVSYQELDSVQKNAEDTIAEKFSLQAIFEEEMKIFTTLMKFEDNNHCI